jgi:hypothetical protein
VPPTFIPVASLCIFPWAFLSGVACSRISASAAWVDLGQDPPDSRQILPSPTNSSRRLPDPAAPDQFQPPVTGFLLPELAGPDRFLPPAAGSCRPRLDHVALGRIWPLPATSCILLLACVRMPRLGSARFLLDTGELLSAPKHDV